MVEDVNSENNEIEDKDIQRETEDCVERENTENDKIEKEPQKVVTESEKGKNRINIINDKFVSITPTPTCRMGLVDTAMLRAKAVGDYYSLVHRSPFCEVRIIPASNFP
ncbi:hypothetical protein FQR65_LT11758 [Abscondita terminalis]|nr:hypothetical protein FQR65_LT11758 [Abscondita terminalis]